MCLEGFYWLALLFRCLCLCLCLCLFLFLVLMLLSPPSCSPLSPAHSFPVYHTLSSSYTRRQKARAMKARKVSSQGPISQSSPCRQQCPAPWPRRTRSSQGSRWRPCASPAAPSPGCPWQSVEGTVNINVYVIRHRYVESMSVYIYINILIYINICM